MRLLVSFLVISSVVLAGCAELRANLEAEPAPDYRLVLPWELRECQFAVAVMPVSMDAIGARIPEGFRVLAMSEVAPYPDQSALPMTLSGEANLGVELFRCASGTGANETANLTDLSYGSVFTFVEPPEDKREENATHHFLKFDVLVSDEERRGLLANEGVPALPGNATFSRFQDVGPGKGIQGLLQLGTDAYGFDLAAASDGAPGADMSFVEFTDVGEGRFVIWRTNVTTTQFVQGTGSVDLSEAGWVRNVVGSDTSHAMVISGVGSFTNGTISFPHRE